MNHHHLPTSRAILWLMLLALLVACTPGATPTPTATPEPSPLPTVAPTDAPIDPAPLAAFWQANGGAAKLGALLGKPLWLDGHPTQLAERAWIQQTSGGVRAVAMAQDWQRTAPADLLDLPVTTQGAIITILATIAPLEPITITVSLPGYTGAAEMRLYDSAGQHNATLPIIVTNGSATVGAEASGALGKHWALVLVDGNLAGASSGVFTLDAQTSIVTGQPRFDDLYGLVRGFMHQDVLEYPLDGTTVHGYRSPDNDLLWLRDHAYQSLGFRYFETDMTSLIDAFRRAQQPDGSIPDHLARPDQYVPALRLETEADVESLFVQAVYGAWQATGDDAWMAQNIEAMRRGVAYLMSDPLRWDAERQLVKRPYTIDTWDFQYGPTTTDPTTNAPAPRHWIDDQTVWGIFHGDNTNLAFALELLARMEARTGDEAAAKAHRDAANGLIDRLEALSWNGRFFTHFVPLQPFKVPGVDTAAQLSLSNAYALNRGVLGRTKRRAIVNEYYRRFLEKRAFAEWYSIDPPFPAGSFGLAGRKGENPGEYVNGGIMPLVGGELARGAFGVGAESYAFDILARYHFIISSTQASYLWYFPEGNPGISGVDTLPTDGWGAAAMLAALTEGAAGVTDDATCFEAATISPRWAAAPDVATAQVTLRYAASSGYVAYRWQRGERSIALRYTGPQRTTLRILLPSSVDQPTTVKLNGTDAAFSIDKIEGSRYVLIKDASGDGMAEVGW